MAAKKRSDSNSVQGALERTKAIMATPVCPLSLTPEAHACFLDIVAQREAASWTRHDLRIAGQLARTQVHIEELQILIDRNGYTRTNTSGTITENPELRSMMSLTATQLNLNKALGLSASQKGLSGAEQEKRNVADRKARAALEKAADEDLI